LTIDILPGFQLPDRALAFKEFGRVAMFSTRFSILGPLVITGSQVCLRAEYQQVFQNRFATSWLTIS
jgi:hypothetical protein